MITLLQAEGGKEPMTIFGKLIKLYSRCAALLQKINSRIISFQVYLFDIKLVKD